MHLFSSTKQMLTHALLCYLMCSYLLDASMLSVSASSAALGQRPMRIAFSNEGTELYLTYIVVFLNFFIASSVFLLAGINGSSECFNFLFEDLDLPKIIHVEHFLHKCHRKIIGLHSLFVQI